MATATQTSINSSASDTPITPRKTRLLLALWYLQGKEKNVNQGKVNDRLNVKGKKSADSDELFAQLEEADAIKIAKKKVSITETGIELLGLSLQSSDLGIEGATIVGSWMAKALLNWIQHSEVPASGAATNGKVARSEIASYEEFKQVALEVYDRLNREHNLNDLVPIYRIRREISDKVSRSQFNEWMLDLQADDLLQLIGGEMPSLTPDIAEDSIETKLGGIRYYVKHL